MPDGFCMGCAKLPVDIKREQALEELKRLCLSLSEQNLLSVLGFSKTFQRQPFDGAPELVATAIANLDRSDRMPQT